MAPDVDIDKMAEATHGFSGADISEICQRAAKNAIRESIAYELERAAKIEAGEISEDDNADYDPVPYITKCVHCPSTRTPLAMCQLGGRACPLLSTSCPIPSFTPSSLGWMRCFEVLFCAPDPVSLRLVACLYRAHFEEAMSRARRSVSEADIRKYDTFNQQQKAARYVSKPRPPPQSSKPGPRTPVLS